MKKLVALLLFGFAGFIGHSQTVSTPPASKKAAVTEFIGLTEVTVRYSRPGVKGREGNIYGNPALVPYEGHPFPWRAGANDNTTIFFADDVQINGQDLPAGKYGFHIIPRAAGDWTLIFSKNNWSWGSFNYDPAEDALRVDVAPEESELVEWLRYDFVNQTDHSADIRMSWERKSVRFTVSTDVNAVTMAHIEKELDHLKGFSWQGLNSAAQFAMTDDRFLDKALAWAEQAAGNGFGAQKNFTTLSTKAQILEKMGKKAEAKAVMDEAIPLATMTELHFYGRSLIQSGQPEEALKIFQLNRQKHPDDNFTTYVGLARGFMALEKYQEAAKYFKLAAPNAPPGQVQAYLDLATQCENKQ